MGPIMQRRFFALLLILAIVFGTPYAGALLYRVMGPWSAVAIEQDGSTTQMQFGPDLPRPEWVPVYPGAMVVQSSRLTSAKLPSGFGILEVATRASFEDVKRFYVDQLTGSGFAVTDVGIGPLDAASAAFLGMAGVLSANRDATDDQIVVQIRTPEGLIPSRLVQVHWRKLSEGPRADGSQR